MPRLSVNLNKVALIRNARGSNLPNLVQVAKDCERFGADGITVHPRPDQRHVRYDDISLLRESVTTEFNIEGNPTKEFVRMVLGNPPHQCTLVPDAPDALTSDAGWDTITHASFLEDVIGHLHEKNIRVSIFMENNKEFIQGAKEVGADRIELYTGSYAANYNIDRLTAIEPFKESADYAKALNLGLNAGHDLNLDNLAFFAQQLDGLEEVSIGHALISDALYLGLHNTIQLYKRKLNT